MQNNYVLKVGFQNEAETEPVSLEDVKKFLIISLDETFNDALIMELITTAREQIEAYLNRSLINRRVIARLQNETGYMSLPYTAGIVEMANVVDNDGNNVAYSLQDDKISINNVSIGTPQNNFYTGNGCNQAIATYDVSYDANNKLPVQFKTAIKSQVSWLYERARGDEFESALSPVVKRNLRPYRRIFIA